MLRPSFAVLMTLSLPTVGHAQLTRPTASATAETEAPDGEIIVTAQRRSENIQTTPISVTALTNSDLAAQSISQTQDLAKAVPGLQLLPLTASPSSFQIGLRGGTENAGAIVTSEPAVAVYVDDVYRGRVSGSNLQFTDIERIEVLRGPQGTLYGRNAFSGAIKVITRKPRDTNWLNASASYGNFDEKKLTAAIGGPVADGVGLSVAALYRDKGDGYITNLALGRKVGKERNYALRGTLNIFGGPLTVTSTLAYTHDSNDGFNAIPLIFPNPAARPLRLADAQPAGGCFYCTLSPTIPRGRNSQVAATVNAAYDFGALTLTSISGYVRTDDFARFDLLGGSRTPTGFARGFERTLDAKTDQFSQELQASGISFDGRLNYIIGLYYFYEKSNQLLSDFFFAPLLPTTLNTKTDSYAAFGQASYSITEALSVTAGLRYTRDDKTLDSSIQSGFVPPVTLVPVRRDDRFTAWSPKIGVDLKVSESLFLFGSVSRGFKAGGYNGLAVGDPAVLSIAYRPQTVVAYEVGGKLTALDRRLRLNVSIFRNELKSLQQTAIINGSFSFAVQNVGDAKAEGVELETTFEPLKGIDLFGNLSYFDSSYRRLTPGSAAFVNNAKKLPPFSKWTWQLGFNVDSGGWNPGTVRFKTGAQLKHFSSYFPTVENNNLISGYSRLDGFVAVATADDRWELSLSGRNLTNAKDFVSGANPIGIPGMPRTYMATVRYTM